MSEKQSRIVKLVISILIPQAVGGLGSIFTASSVDTWYAGLTKASFNPPGWLFAPVWTTLYLMMGIALYLVLRNGLGETKVKIAITMFGIQLTLNLLWSVLFFGLRSPLAGLVDIAFLWAYVLAATIACYRVSKAAGLLLVPYLLWVSFASVLNYTLWSLNR